MLSKARSLLKRYFAFAANYKSAAKFVVIVVSVVLILATLLLFLFFYRYRDRSYPNVYVGSVYVGSMESSEIESVLKANYIRPAVFVFVSDFDTHEIETSDIEFFYDYESTVSEVFSVNRSRPFYKRILNLVDLLRAPHTMDVKYALNNSLLDQFVFTAGSQMFEESAEPKIYIASGEIIVDKGKLGVDLDIERVMDDVTKNIITNNHVPVVLHTHQTGIVIDENDTDILSSRARKLIDKQLNFTYEHYQYDVEGNELLSLLSHDLYNSRVMAALVGEIADALNRDPQNSVFVYEGGKVVEFTPSKNGVLVDIEKLTNEITSSLYKLETDNELLTLSVQVPIKETAPEITNDQVNDLGITEIIGRGSSIYRGSISSRVHNIGVASNKMNGTLIAPGEIFSFNNTVGDISSLTGYQQAYIIKDGRTVLGDGGGVCQVSTTLFRAALDAGLPIVERQAHSYRVTYYEQDSPPGLDATVYSPITDFKFQNDTDNHILVQSIFNPSSYTLDFEIYGTSDGRQSIISDPVISSQSPPPDDLYVDDPELPEGEIRQIDWKAWGARVRFDYQVVRDGEVIYERTFHSNFRPWQAVFLRGIAPVH